VNGTVDLVMYARYVQEWFDYRLQWNRSEFGDIDYITVHSSKIWKLELLLANK